MVQIRKNAVSKEKLDLIKSKAGIGINIRTYKIWRNNPAAQCGVIIKYNININLWVGNNLEKRIKPKNIYRNSFLMSIILAHKMRTSYI